MMKKSTERRMNLVAMTILGLNVAGVMVVLILRVVLYKGDLLEDGSLSLESAPAPGTSLSDVQTCAHPNELLVTGHIRRDDDSNAAGRVQVTITLLSPTGDVLDRGNAWYSLFADRKRHSAHFETRLDTVPPEGSVLRIEWSNPKLRTEETSPGTDSANQRGYAAETAPAVQAIGP